MAYRDTYSVGELKNGLSDGRGRWSSSCEVEVALLSSVVGDVDLQLAVDVLQDVWNRFLHLRASHKIALCEGDPLTVLPWDVEGAWTSEWSRVGGCWSSCARSSCRVTSGGWALASSPRRDS